MKWTRSLVPVLDMSFSMTIMVVFAAFAMAVLALYQRLLPTEERIA